VPEGGAPASVAEPAALASPQTDGKVRSEIVAHSRWLSAMDIHPTGGWVLGGGEGGSCQWGCWRAALPRRLPGRFAQSAAGGRAQCVLHSPPADAVRPAPPEDIIATASEDATMNVWQLPIGGNKVGPGCSDVKKQQGAHLALGRGGEAQPPPLPCRRRCCCLSAGSTPC
jgi:WD40 repeat protein